MGSGLIRAVDSYHFYFSQRYQMWFNMYGRDLRTFWCRTVKVGQGASTGWAKKFEKISNFSPFRDYVPISQKLLKIEAYKQHMEKSFISPLSDCRMCMDPSLTGFYRVSQKLSDVIPVLRITPIATQPLAVSVFLSVAKCSRVCRAQSCTHSGIEPSTLAKGFDRVGQKFQKKIQIF